MLNDEELRINKTLTDIIDPEILCANAMINWNHLPNGKKKQKGFVYNKVLQTKWNIDEELDWTCDFNSLQELQKRMLIKKELINAYNSLNGGDRMIFNQYLGIDEHKGKWHFLSNEDKKQIFKRLM